MSGLVLAAAARPAFDAGEQTLTFAIPAIAKKGALVLLVVASDPADGAFAVPDGWTELAARNGTARIRLLARMLDDNEPVSVALALPGVSADWLGQLLLYSTGAPSTVLEASGGADFADEDAPTSVDLDCQQAINVELSAWSTVGDPVQCNISSLLDRYTSSLVAARSLLLTAAVTNATGSLGAHRPNTLEPGATFTGSVMSFVLRDRPPVTPALLFDPVPGSIGFLG